MGKDKTISLSEISSVRRDTGRNEDDEQGTEPTEFAYSSAERAAIDEANEAFAPIIEAIDMVENIDGWVPPVVKDHDAKDYARAVYKLLGGWLKEPTA